jgi:hypothetical protein
MKIKLQTGKEVYLEAFHCTPTYAVLLVGSSTKETTENSSKKFPKKIFRIFY